MKCEITACMYASDECFIRNSIRKKPPKTKDDCSYFDDGKRKLKRKRRTNIETEET